ncbi:MAG TPA: DUF971 domain-containing protein [Thermoanaerobaculia bacterium]|nr:DUF971 domain-containing protein [Thermoanaerobaculia bacterium]
MTSEPQRPTLTEVRRLPEERRLRLTWSDGHQGEFGYDYLRGWCTCAGCQGHTGLTVQYQPPASPVTAESITPVGNYAISILWSDRHSTGIYRFDFLRRLCPCDACGGAVEGEVTTD